MGNRREDHPPAQGRKNKTSPVPLKYGRDNGLRPGIMRRVKKEKAPVTKLYVQGGERNINRSACGSKSFLLPTDRTLKYEGRTYQTDASGMFNAYRVQ